MQLEERMVYLERRCRMLTVGFVASVCVIGLFILAGAAQEGNDDSTLRTRRVEILDAQGNARIEIGRVEDDVYGVLVYGHGRQASSKLMAGSLDGAGVAIISAGGGKARQGIQLMAQEKAAGIVIRDSKALRTGMLVHGDRTQLQLRNGKQDLIFIAPTGEEPIEGRK